MSIADKARARLRKSERKRRCRQAQQAWKPDSKPTTHQVKQRAQRILAENHRLGVLKLLRKAAGG
jgi:hypothetical protein